MKKQVMILIYSVQTLMFGLFLLFNSGIYLVDGANDVINVLSQTWFSYLIVAISVVGFSSLYFKNGKMDSLAIVLLQFFWSFFALVFLIRELQGFHNTDWVLTTGEVLILWYLARKG